MAQAGFTPISLYYSSTASTQPTTGNLVLGELGLNIADGVAYGMVMDAYAATDASRIRAWTRIAPSRVFASLNALCD